MKLNLLVVAGDGIGPEVTREAIAVLQTVAELEGHEFAITEKRIDGIAIAHESGIHQHGMLANPLCYEIMTPASVGASSTQLVLGKHSGRAALPIDSSSWATPSAAKSSSKLTTALSPWPIAKRISTT